MPHDLRFSLHEHAAMLADVKRVKQIRTAIAALSRPDSAFLELGCGLGVFARSASAQYKRTVGVDHDPRILGLAECVPDGHCTTERVKWICDDAYRFCSEYRGEPFDVVLCELLSPWLSGEPQYQVLSHAHATVLNDGGCTIPASVRLLLQCGSFDFMFADVEMQCAHYTFYAGSRFSPLSPPVLADTVLFDEADGCRRSGHCDIRSTGGGIINAVRLITEAVLAPGMILKATPSTMHDVVVPIKNPIQVHDAQCLQLEWSTALGMGTQSMSLQFA